MKEYRRKVYYYETDKMAIVHNANYLRIFEEARLDFMEQHGIPYTAIEEAGILIPVVDAYVRYHHTLRYGDEFCVQTRLRPFNGVRMEFEYEIHLTGKDDTLITSGRTSHCFISEATRAPLSLKKAMPEAYAKMKAFSEED